MLWPCATCEQELMLLVRMMYSTEDNEAESQSLGSFQIESDPFELNSNNG